ncbi:MAG: outer membrane lipid asymmetry maintenance protein MlaD [Zetaproteobacteria bacterium]|nr:MAG: outer membrane lipid asymmetry maintenance protein MlaD [Zetaproteobacteria bacterium]
MVVGLFVLIGLACAGWMAARLGQVGGLGASGYELKAVFDDIGGVRVGSDVMMAGVVIGRVDDVRLDEDSKAIALLRIDDGVRISEDAFASVRTKGIIGDRYIRITQGVEDSYLADGDEIEETESALNIEDLVSKYIFSGKE